MLRGTSPRSLWLCCQVLVDSVVLSDDKVLNCLIICHPCLLLERTDSQQSPHGHQTLTALTLALRCSPHSKENTASWTTSSLADGKRPQNKTISKAKEESCGFRLAGSSATSLNFFLSGEQLPPWGVAEEPSHTLTCRSLPSGSRT